jgi:hypothetical protein
VTVTWDRALADCEARLDAVAAALVHGAPASAAPFATPDVEGPIPAPLAARARAVAERGAELEERLTSELARLRSELRRLPRMPRAPRESRFDTQA